MAHIFETEIDNVDKNEWYRIMSLFEDASIFQTWDYDEAIHGGNNISHLVLKKQGSIVAACQTSIFNVKYINIGIAYIRYGPLWKLKGMERDTDVFRSIVHAIIEEYVHKRSLFLRIYPRLFEEHDVVCKRIMLEEKLRPRKERTHNKTIIFNIDSNLEELKKSLDPKWRNKLKKTEGGNIYIKEGYTKEYINLFVQIYKSMVRRKNFIPSRDIVDFLRIQENLPDMYKMMVMISFSDGGPGAGAICSPIGNTGICLFAATNELGMKDHGSHLIQWNLIKRMKEIGCKRYDLHGINKSTNPGTYKFKKGLAGKNGREYEFLGDYDACDLIYKYYILRFADYMINFSRRTSLLNPFVIRIKNYFINKTANKA